MDAEGLGLGARAGEGAERGGERGLLTPSAAGGREEAARLAGAAGENGAEVAGGVGQAREKAASSRGLLRA